MADNWANDVNGEVDEEEALRIAIAMSLGKEPEPSSASRSRRKEKRVIDLTREDDEAVGDSRKGGFGNEDDFVALDHGGDRHFGPQQKVGTATAQQATPASAFSALGLDRKKMEEERLARLGKRKAAQVEDEGQLSTRPAQRLRTTGGEEGASLMQRMLAAPISSPRPELSARPPPSPQSGGDLPTSKATVRAPSRPSTFTDLPFPRGVVKRTWVYDQPRQGDDIKIEEVLQKQHLQLAVLSSYQWDEHWMLSKIDIMRTKLILVAFASDEAQKNEMRSNVPRDRIRFCFPPMHGIGSMHSKLMLLKYEKYMRIVVPTGNLMSFDWGETGTMENMAFIIDLPKFETAEAREAQILNRFAEQLFYFLRAQGLDEKLLDSLRNYDFTEAGRYEFVHTIPGSHTGDDALKRIGYCGLGHSVDALVGATSEPVELDYVCATLGAINYGLLTALYYACLGDPLAEYEERTSGSQGKREAFTKRVNSLVKKHMRIFFPSRETVLQSKGGKDGAGTICIQPKWWQAATFPRELVRDCKSVRPGVLMHSKVIYVRPRDAASNPDHCFAYVGSANLSESAWGRISKDRASGKPKLICRNWECGVLVPAEKKKEGSGDDAHSGNRQDMRVFEDCVPVPMEWPGQAICREDGNAANIDAKRPWFYSEG
ncbi:tyrosyl-DNA phosphodiesterase-domain-containing protein [Corynascus similis CBS 632.67]